MNGLDLFSGIGGISLALSPWVRPIAYCEKDKYCQNVLLSRMSDGQIETAPIWDDITTLLPSMLPRQGIDIIYGGFPCQDISVANTNGTGLEGKRSGLFFEIMRLAEEIRPTFIFLENVPNIRTRGLRTIGQELADAGYDCRWDIVSAAEVGAPHIRKRWFLLAHTNSKRLERQWESERIQTEHSDTSKSSWWETEPKVDRMADGVSFRVDRIKALGNAVVPEQVSEAFKRLIGIE